MREKGNRVGQILIWMHHSIRSICYLLDSICVLCCIMHAGIRLGLPQQVTFLIRFPGLLNSNEKHEHMHKFVINNWH